MNVAGYEYKKIRPGELVQMITGGPVWEVLSVEGPQVSVKWNHGKEIRWFSASMLKPYQDGTARAV